MVCAARVAILPGAPVTQPRSLKSHICPRKACIAHSRLHQHSGPSGAQDGEGHADHHAAHHPPHTHAVHVRTRSAISRRNVLWGCAVAFSGAAWLYHPQASHAGLVRFPADQLNNRYFLVRAGQSYAESFGEPLTNPVWKTSERHGLSELGKEQVLTGLIPDLEQLGACGDGCWLFASITQNAYQTAEVVAYSLGIGRNRIVPEYSFLDARGFGALENVRLDTALRALEEGDLLDANWRPQRGTDGTPHESPADVMVRMRQVVVGVK